MLPLGMAMNNTSLASITSHCHPIMQTEYWQMQMEFYVRERQIRFAGTSCSHAMYRVGNSGDSRIVKTQDFICNTFLYYLVFDKTL